ncbi:hypothetical protein BDB01DRAFT_807295 [Pilobolus umbonatus]|nr:hypothetical protein BDB01DRAFT_807295 [Pilobolus umbonatus]
MYQHFKDLDTCTYLNMLNDFIKAIRCFPNVHELRFSHYSNQVAEVVHVRNRNDIPFYQILSQFPSLESLKYDCDTLNTHLCSTLDKHHYPHIKRLELRIDYYPSDSLYIKNAFTRLTELTIYMKKVHQKTAHMLDVLMKLETIETLQLTFRGSRASDIFYMIWNSATCSTFMPEMNVTYGAKISRVAPAARIVVKNFPHTKSRKVTFVTSLRSNIGGPLNEFVHLIKDNFDELNICGCITGINKSMVTFKNYSHPLNNFFIPPIHHDFVLFNNRRVCVFLITVVVDSPSEISNYRFLCYKA